MTRFLLDRLVQSALVLAVMSFVIYALIGLMPGDPIDLMISADPDMTPADAARLRRLYGLETPLVERYGNWVRAALGGDLGFSRTHAQPVLGVLWPALVNTLILLGLSFAVSVALGIAMGLWAAVRAQSTADYAINLVAFAGISVPPFWSALPG